MATKRLRAKNNEQAREIQSLNKKITDLEREAAQWSVEKKNMASAEPAKIEELEKRLRNARNQTNRDRAALRDSEKDLREARQRVETLTNELSKVQGARTKAEATLRLARSSKPTSGSSSPATTRTRNTAHSDERLVRGE